MHQTFLLTNLWNFGNNCSTFGGSWKTQFFWVGHFKFFFSKKKHFFCIILIQIHHKSMGTKDGMKFWWLPWFPAKIYGYIKLWETLYTRSQNVWPKTKVFIIRPSVFGRRIKRLNIAKCLKYSSREGTCAHDLNFLFLHM